VSNRPRCPFDFNQFCANQCAWYNGDAKRCQMLEEVCELANVNGRLTFCVNEVNKTIQTLVEPLRGVLREKRDASTI